MARSTRSPASNYCSKYVILLLICYVKLSLSFCVEIPSGLQSTIVRVFGIDSKQYNLLFSSALWAEMVMAFVGGILVDRVLGIRTGLFVFTITVLLGNIIFVAGAFLDSYVILVSGRFIMGCGLGSIFNVQSAIVTLWFKEKVTLAMAFMFSATRIGAALGIVLPQLTYENVNLHFLLSSASNHFRVGFTFLLGVFLLLISLFATIVIVILDIKGRVIPLKERKFSYKDLKEFPSRFWLSSSACAMFYAVLFIFVANGQTFFISKFGFDSKQANVANVLIFAAPVFATPIFGFLIQSIGYNVTWGMAGALLAMFSHFLFNVAEQEVILPYLIVIVLSISYSFFGISIYPIPALVIQEHQLATAYGLANSLISVAFTVISVVSGIVIDYVGYFWLEIYFIFMTYIILCLLIVVAIKDFISQGKKVNVAGSWLREMIQYWRTRTEKKNAQDVKGCDSEEFEDLYHY